MIGSFREPGRVGPSHAYLWRFPFIRACCIGDSEARAAWWGEVFASLEAFHDGGGPDGHGLDDAQTQQLLDALATKVPFRAPKASRKQTQHPANWQAKQKRAAPPAAEPPVAASNCFAILGMSRGCAPEELKCAWRAAAKANHPDVGGSHEAFVRIAAAYELCQSLRL